MKLARSSKFMPWQQPVPWHWSVVLRRFSERFSSPEAASMIGGAECATGTIKASGSSALRRTP